VATAGPLAFQRDRTSARGVPITTTDREAVAFILDRAFGGFSWLQTNVTEAGCDYEIIVESVPDWYEPEVLAMTLEMLRLSSN
jgi:hypothetical protein